ncbi:MAG: hypothetical protein PHE09_20975 [Oscillospiraceae bacterium]|nr:hypothetical protein [Oscillospiraceae bacterium]
MKVIKTRNGKEAPFYDAVPEGWKRIRGAMTAPLGYCWIWNGKSRFGGECEQGIVTLAVWKKYEMALDNLEQ